MKKYIVILFLSVLWMMQSCKVRIPATSVSPPVKTDLSDYRFTIWAWNTGNDFFNNVVNKSPLFSGGGRLSGFGWKIVNENIVKIEASFPAATKAELSLMISKMYRNPYVISVDVQKSERQ